LPGEFDTFIAFGLSFSESSLELAGPKELRMRIEFGFTPELTNTQYGPLAALAAYYELEKVLKPLQFGSLRAMKGDYSVANKLTQVVLSILAGCEYVSLVNSHLRSEQVLAQLYRIESFADQSTLWRALNGLTQMHLGQLEVAVKQISRQCSQTVQHDWRGFLQLDFDLSGLPCGKEAAEGTKGYISGKKTSLVGN
jgi:hypothetical protein